MRIIPDKNDDTAMQIGSKSSASSESVLTQSVVEEKPVLIHLADVDLSTGKK
jgi:hypothetical protein